ncbi:potassium-transporting ATPase subunit KdpA, partial [bacterium]|nr:potassium-transporting ATPase subunit KdpA [bacterium]
VLIIGLLLSLTSESHLMHRALGAVNWEGKETRFGVGNSVLWSVATAASNGSVNAMHSSLSPLSGAVALFNMMVGEIIFGGVGSGMYGMVLFVLITLFLAGLMVGRTPEYLGKKLGIFEMKMVVVGLLLPNAVILLGVMASLGIPQAMSGLLHHGPHGFSELLYAFTSAAANNGSAFAGLSANTPYYNVVLGVAMLVGRFAVIVPVLAIAGSLARQKIVPPSSGTLPTHNLVFGTLLLVTIVLFAGLTFLPALCLGPIVEHLLMVQGVGL